MPILNQFQISIVSFLFGGIFLFFHQFINRLFFKLKILKNITLFLYIMAMGLLYFYLVFILVSGILRIYYPLFLFFGGYIYQKVYAPYILRFFEKAISKMELKIFAPFYLKINKINNILKYRKKKKHDEKERCKKEKSYH